MRELNTAELHTSKFAEAIAPFLISPDRIDLFVALYENLKKRDLSKLTKDLDRIVLNNEVVCNSDEDAEEDEPMEKKRK